MTARRQVSGRQSSFGTPGGLPPWTRRLLIANTVVFAVMMLGILPFRWALQNLALVPPDLLWEPWTMVTYMFLHAGFMHFLFNMVILFFFGPPLENRWGGTEFVKFYFICGLGPAILGFLLAGWVGPRPVVGASGALYGLLLAFALLWPNRKLYIWGIMPVKAKWLVGFLAFFSLYTLMSGQSGNVAEWAHLGGLVTGFLYLKFFQGGGPDWTRWRRFFTSSSGSNGAGRSSSESGSSSNRLGGLN